MNKQAIHGEAVSDEQIDAWVAEAEAGYDVEMLRKNGSFTRRKHAHSISPSWNIEPCPPSKNSFHTRRSCR